MTCKNSDEHPCGLPVLRATICIISKHGLDQGAAGRLVHLANAFTAEISILCGNKHIDAKNFQEVLALSAGKGSHLILQAEGKDAHRALVSMTHFLNCRQDASPLFFSP